MATDTEPRPIFAAKLWIRKPGTRWKMIEAGSPERCQAALEEWKRINPTQHLETYIGQNDPNAKRRI